MKLYFLKETGRASINIRRLKRYNYNIQNSIIERIERMEDLNALIVLGNGSPEDEVIGITSYHQKGDAVIGITKPDRHHTDAFRELRIYVDLKIRKLLFIIDQDAFDLNVLFRSIESIFREQGITFRSVAVPNGLEKVRLYQCSINSRDFRVIVAISGLDEFNSTKHVIEDHLLMLAGIKTNENAKAKWRSLEPVERNGIFAFLKDRDIAEVVFPQHFCAFELTKTDC
jgi:hypothetical protein